MFGAASLLACVTLAGLIAGFAREWLLVANWGAGARTDAFVIAMFLPEAVRTMLAAGVLSSAALSLWQVRTPAQRMGWLGQMTVAMGLIGVALSAMLSLGAPLWMPLMGPGLTAVQQAAAQAAFTSLVWSIPGLLLQALWAVSLQAQGRFLLAGWGSLFYNLPAIVYMVAWREQSTESDLAQSFVVGSIAMALAMAPAVWRQGLRPAHLQWSLASLREFGRQLAPLLGSALAGQGLMLMERMAASYLGDGVVTVLNLARKLVNLPLMALMSLNQVLLSLMSRTDAPRVALLKRGMATVTVVSVPAAMGLMLSAPALVSLLFPQVPGAAMLAPILGGYAAMLVLAGWITMLARYNYAEGNTRLPLRCELWGAAVQALSMPPLAWALGAPGIVLSLLLSLSLTGWLLVRRNGLQGRLGLLPQGAVSVALMALCGFAVLPQLAHAVLPRLLQSAGVGVGCLLLLAVWLRPWRAPSVEA
ncbi:lipid II flippase MurJ [Aquabacterium sp.]|uniref:murein biosynthesis integral membrane protein MurJ n=1 Tax=Aquabacterium sp. TaxID=1872578 RepID=UPI00198D705E|nr:lipid II flippase MurJ [Aquabacterium sp.]MBC7701347.1 oligosaccharide flippase family protein [Aquabacterium sp.]